ncbi:MAG: GNAT family N-acetyltransferase [Phycisphaerales bacterium]
MADATIDRINPADLDTITHLYNQVFRPERDAAFFQRRLARDGENALVHVARIDDQAVGFYIGHELKPSIHFAWLIGVVPEMRRTGIGTQLLRSAMDWAATRGYEAIRFEVSNAVRPFLTFGIKEGFDIIGLRWDPDQTANLVILEKPLVEP